MTFVLVEYSQDWILGVGTDGSVTVWLVTALGDIPRRYPECFVRAALPAGSLPPVPIKRICAVYDDVSSRIIQGICVQTPSNVFVYSNRVDGSISAHRLEISYVI